MYSIRIITISYNELTDSHFTTCKKYNALEVKDSTIKIFTYSSADLDSIIKDVNNRINEYKEKCTDYSITIHNDNTILLNYESEYYTTMYNMAFSTHLDDAGKFSVEKKK